MTLSGHGFAVEVGVGDGFGDNTTVVGGVAEANNIFQPRYSCYISYFFCLNGVALREVIFICYVLC